MLRLNMMLMMIVATIQAVAIINTTDQDGQLVINIIGQSSSAAAAATTTTPITNTPSSGNDETNQANVEANQSTLPTNIDGIDSFVASCSIQPNRHIALLNQQNVDGQILMWQSSNQTGPLEMSLELTGFKVDCSSGGGAQNPPSNTTGCRTGTILTNSNDDQPSGPPQSNFTKAFGMHIHEGSDTTFGCQSVGNHYNPFNMTHGAPNDQIKHLGDLGNIYADHTGTVKMKLSFDDLSLFGNHSILNRAIVIHSGPDDYGKGNNPASKITGNSGIRIACCIIQPLQM